MSAWVRDIELGKEEHARLVRRARLGPIVAADLKAERARAVRREYQREGRRRAREGDASYLAGCMLYWAEGSKSRNSVQITNADADLLVTFAHFLRQHFGVKREQMRIDCNLFADHLERQRKIEQYWLDVLELPAGSLRKSIVNVYSKYSQKKRTGKLPHGTCRLVVHSTQIVQTIYGSIQEYGGFDRPAWLD